MSVVKSDDILKVQKEMICKKYNVENFYYDDLATMMRGEEESLVNMYGKQAAQYRAPVVRWKIDGKWYAGAVPLVLEEVDHRHWLLGDWTTLETNTFAMEQELIHMIEESRKNGEMGQTLSRDGEASFDVV